MAAVVISIIDAKYIDMAAAYDADLDTPLRLDVYVEFRNLNSMELGMWIYLVIRQLLIH